MRKRSGQVHSRESSATLQLTVSLLYLFSVKSLYAMRESVILGMDQRRKLQEKEGTKTDEI